MDLINFFTNILKKKNNNILKTPTKVKQIFFQESQKEKRKNYIKKIREKKNNISKN